MTTGGGRSSRRPPWSAWDRHASVLDGGINRWVTEGFSTEWGSNVPSKDFGEKVEAVSHVPEIEAKELAERMRKGDKFVILDSRTPEEFRRFCIPGGRNVPGGELALRITDIAKKLEKDTTIIVNCAGRTRSIIGTRVLQRMGLPNVYGLKNGTAGWVLAGEQLETGADRVQLPEPSPAAVAAAEAYAAKLAAEDGVCYLDIPALQSAMERRSKETVYLIDVRTREEYAAGHIPGFRWFPGGQAVQRSDEVAVVKNCPIVFACDGKARATLIASWYRQMGFREVYAVDGGTVAWAAGGRALERGTREELPVGYERARGKVKVVSPSQLHASPSAAVIFVDTSQDFARGHVTGARWVPRGWLEFWITDVVASKNTAVGGHLQRRPQLGTGWRDPQRTGLPGRVRRRWRYDGLAKGGPARGEGAVRCDGAADRCGAGRTRPQLRRHAELSSVGRGPGSQIRPRVANVRREYAGRH